MRISKRLLAHLTLRDVEKMLDAKRHQMAVAPLEKKRDALKKAAEKIQKKIDRLLRLTGAAAKPKRAGRPRGRKPGRPPKAVKRGRPAKKARKMSAAARKRNALAVSRAQKARWAAYRKAKAAEAKAQPKTSPKRRKTANKAPQTVPKPGTLSAKILKVAGPESEQA